MSYLNPLRLHFAGRFQANPSTVNNDPGHFDNASFQPSYQQTEGPHMNPPNGWFNPQGDAAFRLLGCRITSAWLPSGEVTANDPVLQYLVADSGSQVCAKLVDLDSEQQLVSEIWGLQVRIINTRGETLLRGDYEPAAFADIWDRATGAGTHGDMGAGAMYQSVLTNLWWGDISASKFLQALQQASSSKQLSIKFNVDGINMEFTSPDFMCGRLVGTIGPASTGEPIHMLMGRHFMASAAGGGNFFRPAGGINFLSGVVNEAAGCIFLDLGNALSTSAPGAGLNDLGDLTLGAYDPENEGNPAGWVNPLGVIASQGPTGYASNPEWYNNTAGVVALPLTATQLQAIAKAPLMLYAAGQPSVSISEWSSGAFVRADNFVFRLSPGDKVDIPVYASQWGQPLAGVTVNFIPDASQLQPTSGPPYVCDGPLVAVPLSALRFNLSAVTDSHGVAVMTLHTSDPGTPRYFDHGQDYGLDGQVYGIRPAFADPQYSGPMNQWDFISLLLWSGFTPSHPVTWDNLQPIFLQYANLYPVMNRFLNLADYDSVVANKEMLSLAFGLDAGNPNSMPVTRDLSPAKRKAILDWLQQDTPLPGSGSLPVPRAAVGAAQSERPATTATPLNLSVLRGGKAAAASRRLVAQRPSNRR